MTETVEPDFTAMTVQLLSAYFANNQVPAGDIPGIIETTRAALERKTSVEVPAAPEYVPAVSVRKSLGSRDHIISMIDGKPYKTLKRHISTHGLTPAEYRARYSLPADYPMVAPGYSEQRRAVAKQLGLGRKPAVATTIAVSASESAAPRNPVPNTASVEVQADITAEASKAKPARGRPAKARSSTPAILSEPVKAPAKRKASGTRKTAAITEDSPKAKTGATKTPRTARTVKTSPQPSTVAAEMSQVAAPAPAKRKRKQASAETPEPQPAE